MWNGKKILLGVTGSIAAYKSAELTRLLVKAGAEVQCILTKEAAEFITPLTLATLSKKKVLIDYYDSKTGLWNNHVELGLWADLMLIAPVTANTIGKMAHGICDNLLLACYLSARCSVVVCPAMDLDMFAHPTTQQNLETLSALGVKVMEPRSGELASGLSGKGRLPEPIEIVQFVGTFLEKKALLKGKKVLITAGPTREALDPVRFFSNHSTGKMGYALAEAAEEQGAEIYMISGPVHLKPRKSWNTVHVEIAEEMDDQVRKLHPEMDIAIFSAAVADYSPTEVFKEKIKKKEHTLTLTLKKNPDVAFNAGGQKKSSQIHLGFALETSPDPTYAKEKLKKKNFDLIVFNSLSDKGAGFAHDTNQVHVFSKDGWSKSFPLMDKKALAKELIQLLHDTCLV